MESRKADIRLERCGRITLSSRVVRLLRLEDGDAVSIEQGEGGAMLVIKQRNAKGQGWRGVVSKVDKRSQTMFLSWAELARAFIPTDDAEARFRVGATTSYKGKPAVYVITKQNLWTR